MSCPKYVNTRLKYKFFFQIQLQYGSHKFHGFRFYLHFVHQPPTVVNKKFNNKQVGIFFRKIESFLKFLEIFLPVHPFIQNESDFKRYARILQVSNKRPLKFLRKILKFSLQYLASLYYATVQYFTKVGESKFFYTQTFNFL